MKLPQTREEMFKVFCPTGEGGGIDPTCSPADGNEYDEEQLVADLKVNNLDAVNRAIDRWTKGADMEALPDVVAWFENFDNVRTLSLHNMKAHLKVGGTFDQFLGRDVTVYRGGAITGDIINMTINKSIAENFVERHGGRITQATVKPRDIIGYLMRPNGELLVHRDEIKRKP
jgi:hypothetical protein